MRGGDPTPWGMAQDIQSFGGGVWSVATSRHGGFHLEPAANEKIPTEHRHQGGWYEEDCDYAIVLWFYPDLRERLDISRESVRASLERWNPAVLA